MLKQMFCAALLCSTLAAPVLAQKIPLTFGFSLANPGISHPFENPPRPGSSSGVAGGGWGYGSNVPEKGYNVKGYAVEGLLQYAIRRTAQLRLRGGYSFRQTDFSRVYTSGNTYAVRNTERETDRSWHLAAGFLSEHSMGKISLNAGLEIPVYFLDRLESYSTDTDLLNPESTSYEYGHYFPGGISVGIGPVAGISFHPLKWASIGIELRNAWMYTRIKGNYESRHKDPIIWVTEIGTEENYRKSGMSNLQAALQLRIAL